MSDFDLWAEYQELWGKYIGDESGPSDVPHDLMTKEELKILIIKEKKKALEEARLEAEKARLAAIKYDYLTNLQESLDVKYLEDYLMANPEKNK